MFEVVPAAPFLPDSVAPLADHAELEGIRIVSTVLERWEDGSERFLGRGEAILVAVAGDEVVGIGGRSQCPHVPGALRMRRFYVAPGWRRYGVGRSLARQLIEAGHAHTDLLTCNARASSAASPFWESLGFVRAEVEGITHVHRTADAPFCDELGRLRSG
ncbi:MAG: GNAT family N-acetyltransferase [Acidimicrobiales bacterium]|nr:GNAT family N-acetyltransferase [Acidimicrobiales bacterium]